ncbi:hypothetical protein L1987_36219 [Smallanthus sonchifolius]|uniref:Uncharacterized protein n=1 Tax=Smallanthus sonchifolius TaxID=185202 RepID=A0ACB9HCL7_9ASTR|nr:hypothetical protein L1987_36219 [Smallanthus sonchifolius]
MSPCAAGLPPVVTIFNTPRHFAHPLFDLSLSKKLHSKSKCASRFPHLKPQINHLISLQTTYLQLSIRSS